MTALERVTDAVRAEMDRQEDVGTYQPALIARAAILAIREPDAAMILAMQGVDFLDYDTPDDLGTWRAAIDAILNETPE